MDREPELARTDGVNATIIYMVSLYLLLIAFFAILHTISVKEDVRAAAVVGSLRVTFQRPETRTENLPEDSGQPKFSGPNKEFRDQIVGLFGSFMNSARYSMVETGNVLRLSLSPTEFFYAGTSTLRSDRVAMMREMADMVSNPQPYRQNSIEIWLEGKGGSDGAAGRLVEVRRAGVLARDLEKNDVDARQMSIGLLSGDSDRIHITFRADSTEDGNE